MRPANHAFEHVALGGVCFISDLHLSSHLPQTMAQFEHFCTTIAPQFDTLIILGDLFEYWLGDDTYPQNPSALRVIAALNKLTASGKKIGFMAGNRDFLVGQSFAQRAKFTLLPDPCIIQIQNQSVLLTHGDLLCTDDVGYQRFRRVVNAGWIQRLFLKSPAAWRNALANRLRTRSQNRWSKMSAVEQAAIQDVNRDTVQSWLTQTQTHTMIHGHTHQPSTHLTYNTMRMVLPDWDCDSTTHPRWGYIAWPTSQSQPQLISLRQ
jgi:UDP-2,3-diacylglucosamine hydrolase